MQELPDSPISQHNSAYAHTYNTVKNFNSEKSAIIVINSGDLQTGQQGLLIDLV